MKMSHSWTAKRPTNSSVFFKLEAISSKWFVKIYVWSLNLLFSSRSCGGAPWRNCDPEFPLSPPKHISCCSFITHCFPVLCCFHLLTLSFLDHHLACCSAWLLFHAKQMLLFLFFLLVSAKAFFSPPFRCMLNLLTVWEQWTTANSQYVRLVRTGALQSLHLLPFMPSGK